MQVNLLALLFYESLCYANKMQVDCISKAQLKRVGLLFCILFFIYYASSSSSKMPLMPLNVRVLTVFENSSMDCFLSELNQF